MKNQLEMIINKNINPQRDLYYLGAKLIELLDSYQGKEIDYIGLYKVLSAQEDVTINLFSLALDWLFILGVVKKGANGNIQKCF